MKIKETWSLLKSSSCQNQEIQKAFKEMVTPNICIELLEEIDSLKKQMKNESSAKIGDLVSYKKGSEFKQTGLVVYISRWVCVVKSQSGVDNCIDFSIIDNEICDVLNNEN